MTASSSRQRRLLRFAHLGVLTVGFLAVAGAAPAVRGQTPDTPAALLHITQDQDGRGDYRAYRTYRDTQAVLITTRTVLRAALKKPGVADLALIKQHNDPVAWLRDNLQVDFPRDAEVLRITLKGGDPRETALLVNAIAESYLQEFISKQHLDLERRQESLKAIASRTEKQLREKREDLRNLALALSPDNAAMRATKQRLAEESLLSVEKELHTVRTELMKLEADLKVRQEKYKKAVMAPAPNSALEKLIDNDPSVQKLHDRVSSMEYLIERIRRGATPKVFAERTKRMQDELQSTREALEAQRKELRPVLAKKMQGEEEAPLRERIVLLEQLEKLLRAECERLRRNVQELKRDAMDMESLRDEIAQMESSLKKIRAEEANLEKERTRPARITLLEKAEAPQTK